MSAQAISTNYDDPLFDSAHAALTFAHWFAHQASPEPTPHAKLMRGPMRSGKGLGGLDGAAQAGMILAEVAALQPVHRTVITARYAPDFSAEYRDAIMALIPHVAVGLGTGINSRRMISALVQRHLGVKIPHATLASLFGVAESTVREKWRPIRDLLRADESSASEAIHWRLQRGGICD